MLMKFSDFKLDAALKRAVSDLGFTEPTPIQEKALPQALEGRDTGFLDPARIDEGEMV